VIRREGDKLIVSGDMTFDEANELIAVGHKIPHGKSATISLASVKRVDSSALGVLLEWRREAAKRKCALKLENVPTNLKSLAGLYEVTEFIDPEFSGSSP
jgi:phospholipid transport system transporter-binding protein